MGHRIIKGWTGGLVLVLAASSLAAAEPVMPAKLPVPRPIPTLPPTAVRPVPVAPGVPARTLPVRPPVSVPYLAQNVPSYGQGLGMPANGMMGGLPGVGYGSNGGPGNAYAGGGIPRVAVAPNAWGGGGLRSVTVPTPTLYYQRMARGFFGGIAPSGGNQGQPTPGR